MQHNVLNYNFSKHQLCTKVFEKYMNELESVASKKIPTFVSADFRIPDSLDNASAPSTKYIECGLCPSTFVTI